MFRRVLLFALLLHLSGAPAVAAGSGPVDPALKSRLIQAMAAEGGFRDRFDAEVWLTDMSGRLQRHISHREQRLSLLRHIHREAVRADLEPELVLAVIDVESDFDRFAISSAGARGLMQVMPFWLEEIGRPDDNLFTVQTNLRMGCTILRYYLDMENGDVTRALARYNGSLGSFRYPGKVYEALRLHWAQR